MSVRLHILTLFLLAGCLSARGQDLRTGIALDSQYLAAGEFLAWLDEDGDILRTKPLNWTGTDVSWVRRNCPSRDVYAR